jgi:hypothetical protein
VVTIKPSGLKPFHVKHGAVRKAARKTDDAGLAQQLEEFADGRGFDVVQAIGKLHKLIIGVRPRFF